MSKRQHQRQLDRARTQRRRDRYERRATRTRLVVFVMVGLMVLSLVAGAIVAVLSANQDTAAENDGADAAGELDPFADLPEPVCDDPAVPVPDPVTEPYDQPPRFELVDDVTYVVTLVTTCGDIEVELDQDGAPRTVENFLALADDGYYDGTPFHRIAPGFVIQGGDPAGTGNGCIDPSCTVQVPGYQLEDELETARALDAAVMDGEQLEGVVVYPRGTVAMANSGADTQGSQYFVVVAEEGQPFPPNYTVFGRVRAGMEVVDDIVAGPAIGDRAVDPVVVLEVGIDQR